MKVGELKALCKTHGITTNRNKKYLVLELVKIRR